MNIQILNLAGGSHQGSRPRRSEEDWRRGISWSCNTYMHKNNTRKLPLWLSQTRKNILFLILSLMFFFYKSENRKAEQVLPRVGRIDTSGRGRWLEKG
jgi:hypothetical protein